MVQEGDVFDLAFVLLSLDHDLCLGLDLDLDLDHDHDHGHDPCAPFKIRQFVSRSFQNGIRIFWLEVEGEWKWSKKSRRPCGIQLGIGANPITYQVMEQLLQSALLVSSQDNRTR